MVHDFNDLTRHESDNAQEVHKALLHFEKGLLSEETAVGVLSKERGSLGQKLRPAGSSSLT